MSGAVPLHGPRLRVVQWATGNIGGRALREVIRHPALDLVGVFVYDPTKVGVDAGELCGEPPVGVAATTDRDAVCALRPDCVLYMARAFDIDDVVAGVGARRCPTRREPAVPGRNRGARSHDARLYGEPAGQRDPVRMRRAAWHPLDH